MEKLRTIALLGREAGLRVLQDALLTDSSLELALVCTHGHLPRAEGGGPRPELQDYRSACAEAGIPLAVLDGPEARRVEDHLPAGPLDLLVVLSWRHLVSPAALARFRLGGVNLHRGALPGYAGAEPVRRAMEAGERRIAITAHRMTDNLDDGPEVARAWLDVSPLADGAASSDAAEVVKARLLPLYAPLARLAVAAAQASEAKT